MQGSRPRRFGHYWPRARDTALPQEKGKDSEQNQHRTRQKSRQNMTFTDKLFQNLRLAHLIHALFFTFFFFRLYFVHKSLNYLSLGIT